MGSDKIFKRINYTSDLHNKMMILLDSTYRAQVHAVEKQQLIAKLKEFHGVSKLTRNQKNDMLRRYREARLRWVNKVKGQPVLVGLGSARDAAVTEIGKKNIWEIARIAVQSNLGIMTGKWCRGYMGEYAHSFLHYKQKYEEGWAYSSAVPLLGQESDPALLADAPEWYKILREDALSPPHASFVARTPDLIVPAQTLGCLIATPGLGTDEESTRILLDGQMKDRNLSMFSWRSNDSIPPIMILDEPFEDGWVWDGFLKTKKMQVMKQTVHAEDFANVYILRVGQKVEHSDSPIRVVYFSDSIKLAEYVVHERAWQCHENLRKHIASEINP